MDFPQSCGIASRRTTGGRVYPHIVVAETPADLITDMFMGLQLCTPTTFDLHCSFFIVLNLFVYMHTSPLRDISFLKSKIQLMHSDFLGHFDGGGCLGS